MGEGVSLEFMLDGVGDAVRGLTILLFTEAVGWGGW